MSDRVAYIAGLRQLADLLEQHEELPLPYDGQNPDYSRLSFFADSREQVAAFARLLPGRLDKNVTDSKNYGFELLGQLAGLHLLVYGRREQVCERVVVGTETVTRQVPDPSVEVPLVEVTEEVEQVEWRCTPLLADAPQGGQR